MAGTRNSGGRNAKSSALHALEGTFRKGDAAFVTPDPPKGRPDTPPTLAGHALAEWNRMVDRLDANETLTVVDDAALYQYCCLFGETEDTQDLRRETAQLAATLQATIAREATRITNTTEPAAGEVFDVAAAVAEILALQQLIAKQTTQLRQGHMAIRQYLVEFGMTPAARTRVSPGRRADDRAPVNPLDRFTQPKRVGA
jgi:P27 family predicted phage terminase small subunit